MLPRPNPQGRTRVRTLGLIVVIAVALGAAAALLAAPSGPSRTYAPTAEPSLSYASLGWAVIFAVIAWLGWEIGRRIVYGRIPIPGRVVSSFAATLVVLLLFVLVVRLVAPGHELNGPPQATNHTGPPKTQFNNSTANASGLRNGSFAPQPFPVWLIYLGLVGAAAVVALFAVPFFLFRDKGPAPDGTGLPPSALSELEQAIRALRAAGPTDARAVIIALYAQLLQRATRGLGDLTSLTPREIERLVGYQLRLPSKNLHELTALFEEARYSRHELPPSYVDRARGALDRAVAELSRPTPTDL